MRIANREEVATLIFQGVTERVIIGQEEDGQWAMFYLGANGGVIAQLSEGRSREHIIEKTKTCLHGHAKAIFENLFQDAETYLGSMGLQPARTNNEEAD